MGKVSPKEKTRRVKGRRQSRSSGNKYLRPGTLAQLRCSKPSGSASAAAAGKCCCTDLGKKRVALLHARKTAKGHDENARVFDKSPVMLSPVNLVMIARQFYFNYTTPDRSRQEMLSTMTPRPTEHWPFLSKGDGKGVRVPSPHTPKAPRHGPRPPSRLKISEMRQVAAVLFPESAFPSRCLVPSVIPKPLYKSLASNRVLFYEDELCQAVAQNKLR
ncbi:hypothetical protein ACSQ67_007806 [Phaseolus vulgaris]